MRQILRGPLGADTGVVGGMNDAGHVLRSARYFATDKALRLCSRILSASVSTPWMNRNALTSSGHQQNRGV